MRYLITNIQHHFYIVIWWIFYKSTLIFIMNSDYLYSIYDLCILYIKYQMIIVSKGLWNENINKMTIIKNTMDGCCERCYQSTDVIDVKTNCLGAMYPDWNERRHDVPKKFRIRYRLVAFFRYPIWCYETYKLFRSLADVATRRL